jgi:hypothetical protein
MSSQEGAASTLKTAPRTAPKMICGAGVIIGHDPEAHSEEPGTSHRHDHHHDAKPCSGAERDALCRGSTPGISP